MVNIFRWLLRLTSALIVIGLIALALVYWLASRSLPDYSASHTVDGLNGPVEIVRDNANVPHIFGDSDSDVYFGLGFAHAQDRLWQMMLLRRTAQGRLSEMFGDKTLGVDTLMRQLDLYNLAQASVEAQTPATQAALRAYSDGVNAWLNEVNAEALGRGAPEFFLFSNAISPWRPADSIAVMKLMALQFSAQLESEVLRARLSLALPDARLADIMPDAPGMAVTSLPGYASLFPQFDPAGLYQAALAPGEKLGDLSPFAARGRAGASNAWAAAPARSASGSSLLANDPHLKFSAPGTWYLARLELGSGGVIGATVPGIPLVLAGRSEVFGWGLTYSYLDDLDLFVEKLNPDNAGEVLTPDGFQPMRRKASIIQIKDAAPQTIELRWTDNGPVLPAQYLDVGSVTPPGHVMSASWTLLSDTDTSMSAAMALMTSKSVAEGISAGEKFVAPAMNITMADRENVAMKTFGSMPMRNDTQQGQGRLPSPGWIASNRWQGRFDYAANPEFNAPEGGILGNTNNKIVEKPFPENFSWVWGDTQRIQRWEKLMQSREVHTRESFIEVQLDTVSVTARTLLPLVGADLWFTGSAAAEGTPERRRKKALELLAAWNGDMNEHLPEPVIYSAWMRALQDRLIRDELGPFARNFTQVEPLFIERVFRDVNGASAWCDVRQSAPVETCSEIARQALDDALLWIDENMGGELESLRWGDVHVATHDHPVLGKTPVLKWFVNIRQSTSGGDNTMMRGVTSGEGDNPYANVHGVSYRGVYDFADPDSSVFVIPTGQSGNPLSRYYDDMGELWRRGEYVPMSLDPDLARAAAVGITTLTPK
jgi:penicillin G amidase